MKKCSFCGSEKPKEYISSGRSGAICNECLMIINKEKEKNDGTSKKIPEGVAEVLPLNPKKLMGDIDDVVIGQSEAKIQLIMEFYKRFEMKMEKNNVFLLGPSGVGKTHLVRTLSKHAGVNFLEFDATTFSETGFKGREAEEIVHEIGAKTKGDKEKLRKTVVFIDEIDKIVGSSSMNGANKMQQSLLKIIEGSTFSIESGVGLSRNKKYIEVDTSEVTFIVAGACVGIHERETKSVGFGAVSEIGRIEKANSKDLLDFGFIPEFVGRFPVIVELEKLRRDDYKRILLESQNAVIPRYIDLFKKEGLELIISSEDIEELIDETIDGDLGVRGVQNKLVMDLNTLLFDSMNEDKFEVKLAITR